MLITNGGSSGWDEGLIALVDWVDAAWELNGGAVKLNLRGVGMEAPVGQGLTLVPGCGAAIQVRLGRIAIRVRQLKRCAEARI